MTDGATGAQDRHMCPSGRAEEGAVLLGIIGRNGVVGYLAPATTVSQAFVTEVNARGSRPEQQFRFAQPCERTGCRQWADSRCGVTDRVLRSTAGHAEVEAEESDRTLPRCTIRRSCQWFAQTGRQACGVCPLVVTDNRKLPSGAVPVAIASG